MRTEETALPGVLVIQPDVHADDRGFFLETWRAERYDFTGPFVQENLSHSRRGVLRGLHLQDPPQAQGKLVFVLTGEVFDVVADVDPNSPTYGQWFGCTLSAADATQIWIPPGYAHGFAVTGTDALLAYKCTAPYAPECERTIRWDDPTLAIEWPLDTPVLSPKDAAAPALA